MGIWYSNIVGRAAKCLYIARAITRLVDGNSGIFCHKILLGLADSIASIE